MLLLGTAAVGSGVRPARASAYPDRTIHYIIPYVVGGGVDTIARMIGPDVGNILGQSLVPDNHGGANGNIGAGLLARADPDGYSVMVAAANLAISQSLYKHLPFQVPSSFAPITLLAKTPSIIAVNPKVPAKSLQELIALAKTSPGKYSYASDQGGPQALGMALLTSKSDIKLTAVPYAGTGESLIAAIGGQLDIIMAPASILLSHVNNGQLRPIAVSSITRLEQLPDVPTVAESGVSGFDVNQWYGVFAPAGTPKEIVDTLNHAFVQALKSPTLAPKLQGQVMIPIGNSPEEFATFLNEDVARWAEAMKDANLKQL
jgi:tripartite-type tricarboxylate transporter receptor subunit TctC